MGLGGLAELRAAALKALKVAHPLSSLLLRLLLQEAELRVCDFKPQELFNVAWAFAQLGHHPRRLFDALAGEVVPRAFDYAPQELSGTLWALAKMRHATRSTPPLLHVSCAGGAASWLVKRGGAGWRRRHDCLSCNC